MSRETEKMLREVQKFLDNSGPITDEAELEARILGYLKQMDGPFSPKHVAETPREKAEELLDEAYEAEDEKVALRKAKAALKMDPTYFDAELFLLDFEKNDEAKQAKLEKMLEEEKARLDANEDTKDEEGYFYALLETRPYMRLGMSYLELLQFLGKNRKAMLFAEGLLVLDENDSTGVRYILMSIYAQLEEESRALQLYKRFPEESVQMLLPLILLNYKLDHQEQAKARLRDQLKVYPDFIAHFGKMMSMRNEELDLFIHADAYKPNTYSEIFVSLQINAPVLASSLGFVNWLQGQKTSIRQANTSSKRVDFKEAKKSPRRKK